MNEPVKGKNMEKPETSKLVSVLIVLLSLAAGLGGTWALFGENIDDNTKSINVLREEGSKVALQNKSDLLMQGKDIKNLQETVNEMKKDQKTGFQEILKRLPQ